MCVKLKTIIFDFDGVILDSAGLKLDAFVEVYSDEVSDKRRCVHQYASLHGGVSRRKKFEYFEKVLFRRNIDAIALDRLCARYGEIVDERLHHAHFIAGAKQAMEDLYLNYDLHVVSGAPEDDLIDLMRAKDLIHYFSNITGAPTTKQDAFKRILLDASIHPFEALAIGDSMTEFEAADLLGIPFLAVVADDSHDPFPSSVPRVRNLNGLVSVIDAMKGGSYYGARPKCESAVRF
jgi:phosphoglycolate phosphatase-like HAD superfamily hydrolase